jgi:hypothetical protein
MFSRLRQGLHNPGVEYAEVMLREASKTVASVLGEDADEPLVIAPHVAYGESDHHSERAIVAP